MRSTCRSIDLPCAKISPYPASLPPSPFSMNLTRPPCLHSFQLDIIVAAIGLHTTSILTPPSLPFSLPSSLPPDRWPSHNPYPKPSLAPFLVPPFQLDFTATAMELHSTPILFPWWDPDSRASEFPFSFFAHKPPSHLCF